MDINTRFWAKVQKSEGCWEWTASLNTAGYGKFSVVSGSWILAHRASWEMHSGAIPADLCVLHKCDNPACVNPVHLFLGDRAANNADARAKGRSVNPMVSKYKARNHCSKGHEYTPENTRIHNRTRQCRACCRIYDSSRPRRVR